MTAVTGRPSRARDDPRGPPGHRAHCDGGARQPIDPQPRLVLRCPGPLLALRSLAALYRVSAQRLATVLTNRRALLPRPLAARPTACAPARPATVGDRRRGQQCLGEYVSDATRAKWTAATQPDGDHPRDAAHLHAQHAAAAVDRGPRGVLVLRRAAATRAVWHL